MGLSIAKRVFLQCGQYYCIINFMKIDWILLLWILSGIATFLLLYLWIMYNSFIGSRNQVKTDFADIDVQLRRRASLIENLVAIVREYAKHENKTFTQVAEARSALDKPRGAKETQAIDNMLTSALRSLFAVSEAYPKLLASENYKALNQDIKETENLIARYREEYNQTVLGFNTKVQIFPNLLVAHLFGFKEEELFVEEAARKADIKISSKS